MTEWEKNRDGDDKIHCWDCHKECYVQELDNEDRCFYCSEEEENNAYY